ncbi:MAG: class I SAM-dependent methyltransferase [Burkholderiaceae bacterium]
MFRGTDVGAHGALMNEIYRRQRHIYDLTRRGYLLGRDLALQELMAHGGPLNLLELGCGTGRNLVRAARMNPRSSCFGVDASSEMLLTARRNIARARLDGRIRIVQGDARRFVAQEAFARMRFDRVLVSYMLSMVPGWEEVLERAIAQLAPGGMIAVVDFGSRSGYPAVFDRLFRAWLARFHVTPRDDLDAVFEHRARKLGLAAIRFRPICRDYAVLLLASRPGCALLHTHAPIAPGASASAVVRGDTATAAR